MYKYMYVYAIHEHCTYVRVFICVCNVYVYSIIFIIEFFNLKMFKLYIEIINTMKTSYIFPAASTIPIHNQGNATQLMP